MAIPPITNGAPPEPVPVPTVPPAADEVVPPGVGVSIAGSWARPQPYNASTVTQKNSVLSAVVAPRNPVGLSIAPRYAE
jgi:hypothetical protein